MEVPTLTIACHEGHPPADDIFVHPGCAQPVPARSPCPDPGPATAPHRHQKRQEDRRGRFPHYQRPRRRPGDPGRQAPLGPRRHLSGRQITGQNGKRTPRDGIATQRVSWPSACCAWTATPTSPPPTATTPAIPSARSRYFRPHERPCRVPGPDLTEFLLMPPCVCRVRRRGSRPWRMQRSGPWLPSIGACGLLRSHSGAAGRAAPPVPKGGSHAD